MLSPFMNREYIAVVDPAMKVAETDCFNNLVAMAPLPLTYHLPVLVGTGSLKRDQKPKAIIILGSASSVNDNFGWQNELAEWLKPKIEAGIPTLGICFGHQFLAHLFGGRVEFMPEKKKECGFREIELSANSLWGNRKLKGEVYVSHCEVVTATPPTFEVVGKSALVSIDAMAHRKLPVWGFQAHPEATCEFAARHHAVPPENSRFSFGQELVRLFLNRKA